MKKYIICLPMVALLSVFIFTSVYSQEDMTNVDNSVFENPQRPPSVFNHDAHNEAAGIEECSECHHLYEDGKKVEDESSEDQQCSDCHGAKTVDGQPSLINAFHENCKACHEKEKKGPIMCGQCHVK